MEINGIIMFSIGLAVFGIVIVAVMPGVINGFTAATINDTSAKAIWGLLAFIMVAVIAIFLTKQL
jgi:hypothetical protein